MRKYIIRRLLISVLILFFVSFIIYVLMRCLPTSYVQRVALERSMAPGAKPYEEWLAQLNSVYSLDKNIFEGFFVWLGNAVRGNFGDSWAYNIPVIEKFSQVIWDSFILAFVVTILEFVIAVPLGILSARKQYSKTDYAITVAALIGISLPSFFFASTLKYIFSVNLGWVDLYGKVGRFHQQLSTFGQIMDIAQHYILPVATLTIVSIGSLMRYTRTNMLEVLNSDYIRTARAKGLPENRVINYHGFRNTLIPIITIFGNTLPALFSGAMITEIIFQIPGVGYTFYKAILVGDIPFAMFYMLFISALTLLGTLLADILYAVADPRVRIA